RGRRERRGRHGGRGRGDLRDRAGRAHAGRARSPLKPARRGVTRGTAAQRNVLGGRSMLGTFEIERRFSGPTGIANGGYTCGVIASFAPGPVTVRLLKPVPLETPLTVERRDDGIGVLHDGTLVAQA